MHLAEIPSVGRRVWIAAQRHPALASALLAALLTAPSLGGGFLMDDYMLLARARGESRVYAEPSGPLQLFELLSGKASDTLHGIDAGGLPWWSHPQLRMSFLRPLSSLSHYYELRHLSGLPALMHLHNILLYAALAALAALLYRRFSGSDAAAGLCALLFAVDYTHGAVVGWIANRNALLAALFGLGALWAHDRAYRQGNRAAAALAVGLLGCSLLAGEAGIATCAYLFAHALYVDPRSRARALLSLLPYGVVVLLWRAAFDALGHGSYAMGAYVDPGRHPVDFLWAVLERAPLLLLSQWGAPPAETRLLFNPLGQQLHLAGAYLFCLLAAWLFWPVLSRDRVTRFYLLGMLLALLPICATTPMNRLLLFVGFGAMGLMGELLREVRQRRTHLWPGPTKRRLMGGLAGLLVFVHLVLSPPTLAFQAAMPFGPPDAHERGLLLGPLQPGDGQRDLVLLNPPEVHYARVSLIMREARGLPPPGSLRPVAPGNAGMTIERVDDRSLRIRPDAGFCGSALRLFCGDIAPVQVGTRIAVPGLTVDVEALGQDNLPTVALLRFSKPLHHDGLRLLQWDGQRYRPFVPPPVGHSLRLAGHAIW